MLTKDTLEQANSDKRDSQKPSVSKNINILTYSPTPLTKMYYFKRPKYTTSPRNAQLYTEPCSFSHTVAAISAVTH